MVARRRPMPDDDAFLRAILAHPDDDLPRLVYADWLDERGDPKGEFIRLQCELERLAPNDPGRKRLESREAALWAAHQSKWEAPLRRLGAEYIRFHRGLPQRVAMSAADF